VREQAVPHQKRPAIFEQLRDAGPHFARLIDKRRHDGRPTTMSAPTIVM